MTRSSERAVSLAALSSPASWTFMVRHVLIAQKTHRFSSWDKHLSDVIVVCDFRPMPGRVPPVHQRSKVSLCAQRQGGPTTDSSDR